MSKTNVKPWIEVVSLHSDVLSDDFSEDIFALDLGPLADNRPHVPAAYRDPEHFFQVSYLTAGLKSLLKDVLSRLAGGNGNRVLKLITPFGGGKSHTLATLLHAARNRAALDVLPEGREFPRPENVRTAVFDGQFFDALSGKKIPGETTHAKTIWGWIAWCLGGDEGYQKMAEHDNARVAPGGDEILEMFEDGPNLILLDEVLNYLISAGGIKAQQTTLRDETLTFLQRLTVAAGNTKNTALVFSLQSSKRESLEYVNLLQTVDHLAARKDQRREPVEGNEIMSVIQRRLLSKETDPKEAMAAASAYQDVYTQMRKAYAKSAAEAGQAEEDGLQLRDRMRAAYPFHPALIDLMRERWAAIPDFQRTRGALRFLAACLRATHRSDSSRAVLSPADVPIQDAEVRLAFFKEVGQQEDFQAVLEHDIVGVNARARRIDDRRARENPSEAGKRHAMRLATAILMYSFGGLRRKDGKDTLPPGISENDLLSVCVGPELDSTTARACLKELKDQCLYLHFDGVRYSFKKDPNVTLLVEQEADAVARDEGRVRSRIKEMLETRLAGHHAAVVWPEGTADIPNEDPRFLFAYLPVEFGGKSSVQKRDAAIQYFEKYGDKPRKHRNGLALVIPSADQSEILRRSVRYLLALERIKAKAKQLNLTDEQNSQVRERQSTENASVESAFLKLYAEVWLPRVEGGVIGIERAAVGGRPLQTTLNQKRQAAVHERIIELLTQVQTLIFETLAPSKIIELFRLDESDASRMGVDLSEVVSGFFSYLGFTRLISKEVLTRCVAKGVKDGFFGYYPGRRPPQDDSGRFKLAPQQIRFKEVVSEDEIDLDAGCIMLPAAIPEPSQDDYATPAIDKGGAVNDGAGGDTPEVETDPQSDDDVPGPTPPIEAEKVVQISFSTDREGLFEAWNAAANLADLAGKITVTLKAESEAGFDESKLQNGVLEPLREADLIE